MDDDTDRDSVQPHHHDHAAVCPIGWLIEDVGRFLAGEDTGPGPAGPAPPADADGVRQLGRDAVVRGAREVNELLHSAYAAHEVVASELRLSGPAQGDRRTLFADMPTPVGLLLLCLRLCDPGDEVELRLHTAARGTTGRRATWPFGVARAEELTRPPQRQPAPHGEP